MSQLNKFEALLYEFEEPSVSKRQIDKLISLLNKSHVYSTIFDSYVSRRLQANIHPERLLNMAYNLEKNDNTKYLSESINVAVANSIILKDENYDQFYFMNRHDIRVENHIFKTVIEKIGDCLDKSSIDIITKIAFNIRMDKHLLLLKALGTVEFSSFRTALFMDRLEIQDQYMLAVRAFEDNNEIAPKLLKFSNKNLYNHMSGLVSKNGDKDQFITALRNSVIEIEKIEYNDFIYFLLTTNADHIPSTLGRLYVRAEQEGRFSYLLTVCAHKNKKDVLRTLCQTKDKELIDKFFSIYKDHPDVKHLVPFL